MNVPYVRQTDDNGTILNPIEGVYAPTGPNRRARRFSPQEKNFNGRKESNGRTRQKIKLGNGRIKTVAHETPAKIRRQEATLRLMKRIN